MKRRRPWLPSRLPGGSVRRAFTESTLAQLAWDRTRGAARRWGLWGASAGVLVGALAFLPAAWLASGVASASGGRLLLADARGTVWSGSAVPVLSAGPDSRDAATLPGRLSWNLAWRGLGFELSLRQPCCLQRELALQIRPGLGRVSIALARAASPIGHWPAAWLTGLGTPWNTLQLGGTLTLSSPRLNVELVQGRWRVDGQADIDLNGISSRLSPLRPLGSYRISIADKGEGDTATVQLRTLDGVLQLSGQGQWTGARLRFRGEARAAEGTEGALNNLLNIIGRRQGVSSVISIG